MTYYVLVCLDCADDLPIPFTTPDDRGEWAAKHTAATGHDRWFVTDQKEK
jgi:hypothetical protein